MQGNSIRSANQTQMLSYAKELEQRVKESLIETLLYCEPGLCKYRLELHLAFGEFAYHQIYRKEQL